MPRIAPDPTPTRDALGRRPAGRHSAGHHLARAALRALPHLLLAAALWWQVSERRAADAATVPVLAEVLMVGPAPQLLGGGQPRALLGFRTRDGRRVEVAADADGRGVGQRAPLRYDPAWPARVVADDPLARWGGTTALVGAWTLLALLRLGFGLRRHCRDAMPQPG